MSDLIERLRVDCCDGKYTVIQRADGGTHALLYGEEWRNCVGDGLILGLAQDLEEWKARAESAERGNAVLTEALRPFAAMPGCWEMHEDDVIYKNAGASLTAGDFRQARTALSDHGGGDAN